MEHPAAPGGRPLERLDGVGREEYDSSEYFAILWSIAWCGPKRTSMGQGLKRDTVSQGPRHKVSQVLREKLGTRS